jgi:hypothetical protein
VFVADDTDGFERSTTTPPPVVEELADRSVEPLVGPSDRSFDVVVGVTVGEYLDDHRTRRALFVSADQQDAPGVGMKAWGGGE